MQIDVKRTQPTFNPVTLTLKFESKDELKTFRELMRYDLTIPKVLLEKEYIEKEQALKMEQIMRNIFKTLAYYTT